MPRKVKKISSVARSVLFANTWKFLYDIDIVYQKLAKVPRCASGADRNGSHRAADDGGAGKIHPQDGKGIKLVMNRIVIIGGGIAGLSAAYYATKKIPNAQITLIESSNRWGGKIITDRAIHR